MSFTNTFFSVIDVFFSKQKVSGKQGTISVVMTTVFDEEHRERLTIREDAVESNQNGTVKTTVCKCFCRPHRLMNRHFRCTCVGFKQLFVAKNSKSFE